MNRSHKQALTELAEWMEKYDVFFSVEESISPSWAQEVVDVLNMRQLLKEGE